MKDILIYLPKRNQTIISVYCLTCRFFFRSIILLNCKIVVEVFAEITIDFIDLLEIIIIRFKHEQVDVKGTHKGKF